MDDGKDIYGQMAGGATPKPPRVPERIPLWKLEEMMGNPAPAPGAWREAPSAQARRPRRRTVKTVWALIGTAVLLVGFYFLTPFVPGLGGQFSLLGGFPGIPKPVAAATSALDLPQAQAPADIPAGATARQATDHPPPGIGENPRPLGQPAPLAGRSSSYAFMHTRDDGKPVTYDPCRAVHYVTRPGNEPAAGPQLIREAIAAVSHATGLVFINDGATAEAPSADHQSYQKARYGDRWAPVLIAWETNAEEPRFTNPEHGNTVMGLGGSEAVSVGDTGFTYVSGQVGLNGPALQRMIAESGTAPALAVIEHELGHVVGLDHVSDPSQLMNPSETPGVSIYGTGDLTGLAALGQGKCQPGL